MAIHSSTSTSAADQPARPRCRKQDQTVTLQACGCGNQAFSCSFQNNSSRFKPKYLFMCPSLSWMLSLLSVYVMNMKTVFPLMLLHMLSHMEALNDGTAQGEPQRNIYKICGLRSLSSPSDLAVPTFRGLALRQSLIMIKINCFSKRGKHFCNIIEQNVEYFVLLQISDGNAVKKGFSSSGNWLSVRPSVGLTAWSWNDLGLSLLWGSQRSGMSLPSFWLQINSNSSNFPKDSCSGTF